MRRCFLVALSVLFWSTCLPAVAADDFSGSWAGPWYRGMTSGTMELRIDANGAGVIQFTNLDNFGEEAVTLSNVKRSDKDFEFSAAGAGASVFVASVHLTSGGKVLKGKAEYDGFPIKFNLKRR
jgi:hypothetical protein